MKNVRTEQEQDAILDRDELVKGLCRYWQRWQVHEVVYKSYRDYHT